MQVEVKIDEKQSTPKIIIITDQLTEEINDLVDKLSKDKNEFIIGSKNQTLEIIPPELIIRAYAANQKVYVCTMQGEYSIKLRLYQLEERLNHNVFVRISHSEIINLKMVKSFDLNFVGTICVTLKDNTTTYVSRRYVSKIKKILEI